VAYAYHDHVCDGFCHGVLNCWVCSVQLCAFELLGLVCLSHYVRGHERWPAIRPVYLTKHVSVCPQLRARARGHEDQRGGRLRGRRPVRPRVATGHHSGRLRLHGGAVGGALPRRQRPRKGVPRDSAGGRGPPPFAPSFSLLLFCLSVQPHLAVH
jgi:hypothetical protein